MFPCVGVRWQTYGRVTGALHMLCALPGNNETQYLDSKRAMLLKPGTNESQKTLKGRHKRESKNAKQMRNTKQNCFSHSSAAPRNNKQCSAKQCFANQTNRCLADFASRSDLFLDNEHG